jgi:putative membrane protein
MRTLLPHRRKSEAILPARQPGPNELRDHLANERTFLAWVRTSITIIALGFVVAKFGILLREVGGSHVQSLTARAGAVVGVALVVGGILTAVLAALKFQRIRRDIERSVVDFSPTLDIALAIVVVAAGIILAVYMIVTA